MTNFIVRIEVHNSENFNYDTLHDVLDEQEFFRILDVDGRSFELPDGTYLAKFSSSPEAVRQIAEGAVKSQGWTAGIVVAKLGDLDSALAFSGLKLSEDD